MGPANRMATNDELLARCAAAYLYLVEIRRTPKWDAVGADERSEIGRQHLLFLWELEVAGKLFAAGPLEHKDPAVDPVGILIFATGTREEAQRLAEEEPFHRAGMRCNRVKQWKLNEGATAFFGLVLSRLAGHPNSGILARPEPPGRPPVRRA